MSETTWSVTVDKDLCIGSGGCVLRAPEAFELDAARQSCPRVEVMAASDEVLDAAENCPVEAITIVEEGTGTVVFPPAD
ncbi:MAG: ferredoxin [Catenulispora sp.]|nr:ferredoxin [Catenulispora sp.]